MSDVTIAVQNQIAIYTKYLEQFQWYVLYCFEKPKGSNCLLEK